MCCLLHWSLKCKTSYSLAFLTIGLLLYAYGVLRAAWISDDAYITMRTVDNFVRGYGLTWNVVERVQVYTHPLWMFVLLAGYALIGNAYTVLMTSSLLIAALTIGLWVRYGQANTWLAGAGVLCLASSRAFVHYSTSGLENPLTHLLLLVVLLFARAYQHQPSNSHFARLCLLACLAILNRQDIGVIVLPILVWAFLRGAGAAHLPVYFGRLCIATIAFLPYVCWTVFSLFYYGVPFPNTAYAKLNVGAAQADLSAQALRYLAHMLTWDPASVLTIVASAGFGAICFVQRRLKPYQAAALLGIGLYLGYMLRIGGDFMAGRFWAAPCLCAVVVGVDLAAESVRGWRYQSFAMLAGVIWLGLMQLLPSAPLWSHRVYFRSDSPPVFMIDPVTGISDERGVYYEQTGLLKLGLFPSQPVHEFGQRGATARQNPRSTPIIPPLLGVAADSPNRLPQPTNHPDLHQLTANKTILLIDSIGFWGYSAGPDIHLLDVYALADPLLSQLPAATGWRIGHFRRNLPVGYVESLSAGQNKLADPTLAQIYDEQVLITRGELWSSERLKAILRRTLAAF